MSLYEGLWRMEESAIFLQSLVVFCRRIILPAHIFHLATGKVYPAMTVVIRYLLMNLTTVNIARENFVIDVLHTARNAILRFVWDVPANVHHARNLYVNAVLQNVRNVKKFTVRIV